MPLSGITNFFFLYYYLLIYLFNQEPIHKEGTFTHLLLQHLIYIHIATSSSHLTKNIFGRTVEDFAFIITFCYRISNKNITNKIIFYAEQLVRILLLIPKPLPFSRSSFGIILKFIQDRALSHGLLLSAFRTKPFAPFSMVPNFRLPFSRLLTL